MKRYQREANKANAKAIKAWRGRIEVHVPSEDGGVYGVDITKKSALSFIERMDVCNYDSELNFDHVCNYVQIHETY